MDTNDKKPNVFISWSGPRSKHVALALRKWLPEVIQAAQPWMSDKDIRSGSVSVNQILHALESTQTGIICLTPENTKEEWINFESGALLKTPNAEASVCTYLLAGLDHIQLEGPLKMFQGNKADEAGTRKLIEDMNMHLGATIPPETLTTIFNRSWPDLKKELATMPAATEAQPPRRDTNDIAGEILEHVRSMRPQLEEIAQETARNQAKPYWSQYGSFGKTIYLSDLAIPNVITALPSGEAVTIHNMVQQPTTEAPKKQERNPLIGRKQTKTEDPTK